MIVNLNPQQFLAVYNSLTADPSLTAKEVKSKMDLVLIEALSNVDESKGQLKFNNWAKQEERKVEALKTELASMTQISVPKKKVNTLKQFKTAKGKI